MATTNAHPVEDSTSNSEDDFLECASDGEELPAPPKAATVTATAKAPASTPGHRRHPSRSAEALEITSESAAAVENDAEIIALKQRLEQEMHLDDAPELADTESADAGGTGGFKFDSPEHKEQLKAQRAQLWAWLKQVGSSMFKEGINLTKISLPVCLFEARSFLERLTQNWEYHDLLTAAANCTNPVDRMRYVVAFACSGLCRQISFHKPFNPILGETYQAQYEDGVQVFCEQISHHPPVSSWQVLEPSGKYVFFGNGNWIAGIKGNSVKGRQTGTNCIRFGSDGASIKYELPGLQVKGVLWGERVLKYGGEMVFIDEKNNLVCEVSIDSQPPKQGFLGGWFSRKNKAAAPYKPDQIKGVLRKGDQLLDTCSGNWLSHLEWETGVSKGAAGKGKPLQRLWDIRNCPLTLASPQPDVLSSDCRHRADLIHLKAGNQTLSQEWKIKLENIQRQDRKLRKEGGGYAEH